jgi:Mce-associated membrane protein
MTSSRNPTPRPRRVAGASGGRGAHAGERLETSQAEAGTEPEPTDPDEGPSTESPGFETGAGAPSSTTDQEDEPTAPPADRVTLALVLAVMVLVAVALLQAAYLWGPLEDDPTVSGERPVLLSRAAERSATDTAAKAAVAFTQRSYETYDEQVDEAAAMMTADFEKQFRQTTDDARGPFIEAETQVTAEVAAQGVMTASEQQVEALVFLNQFTIRKGEESVFTPYRLKVTLIDTEQGWLVSDVEAA